MYRLGSITVCQENKACLFKSENGVRERVIKRHLDREREEYRETGDLKGRTRGEILETRGRELMRDWKR